ncbi:hypothetical protein F2Q68_00015330 [Brassica cretica]|uniref:Uncharacterized protein n=1 Tax=Brassica cretica TaxID=69181 RepID=A0A8S9HMD1_BRACR|nr:hypothetical protein F2Q68_00015330 [Brassica cretica]
MVRGSEPAGLRTLRQSLHGQDRRSHRGEEEDLFLEGNRRKGPRVQGWLAERQTNRSVRAIAAASDSISVSGASRQRLRVAKGHEVPKVVRYQMMQVTKRYEIPRVASIKGYEDQRVPMTKGCIVIPRMQCIVIQDLRSCRDPRGVTTNLINESVGMNKSYLLSSSEDGLGTIAYKAKGFWIVHEARKARWELFDVGVKIRTLSRIIE